MLRTRNLWLVAVAAAITLGAVACSGQTDAGTDTGIKVPSNTTVEAADQLRCATPGLPTTVAFKSLPGVDADLTSVDIHTRSEFCDAPVVVWVHGGGYAVGDKANQISDKAALFNAHGWILVSVNYRLTTPDQADSAEFPDHFEDVADAVAWVHREIDGYGGDPNRIALLGHSAGADIVANVVTNPTYLTTVGLDLHAITCAGPLDTEGFDKVAAGAGDPDGDPGQWERALGNNPDYLTATSATLLVKPGIGIPPMIGVVRGGQQRRQIETAFLQTLETAGIPATTVDASGLSHEEVNSEIGRPGDTVMTEPIVTFLTGCFQDTPDA